MNDWLTRLSHPWTLLPGASTEDTAKPADKPRVQRAAPAPETSPSRGGVEICRRPAHIDQYQALGVQGVAPSPDHWRLRTPAGYRGEGRIQPRTSYADLPPIAVTDDADGMDEPGATCVPAGEVDPRWRDVDAACVDRMLPTGRPLGRWIPLVNDCHTTVVDALDACAAAPQPAPTHPIRRSLYDAALGVLDWLGMSSR